MEHFVEHLTPTVVNGQIFPSVIQGFMDTNPVVREHTIKVHNITQTYTKRRCPHTCLFSLPSFVYKLVMY